MTTVVGGLIYWLLIYIGAGVKVTSLVTFAVICILRYLAVRYDLSLPKLKSEE